MCQTKVVEKIKTHFVCSITLFRKSCCLWHNVEKYGTARQATDDNIIRRMRFALWITKATDTHSECVILIAFPRQQWLRERVSVLQTLPVTYIVLYHLSYCTIPLVFLSLPCVNVLCFAVNIQCADILRLFALSDELMLWWAKEFQGVKFWLPVCLLRLYCHRTERKAECLCCCCVVAHVCVVAVLYCMYVLYCMFVLLLCCIACMCCCCVVLHFTHKGRNCLHSCIFLYSCILFTPCTVYCSHRALSINHNIQSNKMHYIFVKCFILQYLVDQSYTFRSLIGSLSGIHIKVVLHKTELAVHVHIEKM
jgi:hypothetical protein